MQHENTLSTAGLLPGLNIPTAQAARVSGTPQGIRVLRLARAVAAGLALMVSTMSAVRAADPIWDHTITHISVGPESPRTGHSEPHLLKSAPITTDGARADG